MDKPSRASPKELLTPTTVSEMEDDLSPSRCFEKAEHPKGANVSQPLPFLFRNPEPKRHALFQTQQIMGIGSLIHAVLIFYTDYQTSEPVTTLFNCPKANMLIMHVYDWSTILAIAILPWVVDGFDAVLPRYFYTTLAFILAPMLLFMDPLPKFDDDDDSSGTAVVQPRRRSSITEDSSVQFTPTDGSSQVTRRHSFMTDVTPDAVSPRQSLRLRLSDSVLKELREIELLEEASVVLGPDDDQQSLTSEPKKSAPENYRDPIVHVFVTLHLMVFALLSYQGPLTRWIYAVLAISILATIGLSRLAPVTTSGERLFLALLAGNVWLFASLAMLFVSSPCLNCGYLFVSTDHSSYSLFQSESKMEWRVWQLLLKEEEQGDDNLWEEDIATAACRQCIQGTVSFFSGEAWSFSKILGTDPQTEQQPVAIQELPLEPDQTLQDDAGDLAAWYLDYVDQTTERDIQVFNSKVLQTLAQHGHLSGEDLSDSLAEYFCSPASRFDRPDPTRFLSDLHNSRFSGENGLPNLKTSQLQRIMRGDVLKELGVR